MATAHTPRMTTTRQLSFLMRQMTPSAPLNFPSVTRTRQPQWNLGLSSPRYSIPRSPDEVTSMKMFISRSGMAKGIFFSPSCLVYRITLSVSTRCTSVACLAVERKNMSELISGRRTFFRTPARSTRTSSQGI